MMDTTASDSADLPSDVVQTSEFDQKTTIWMSTRFGSAQDEETNNLRELVMKEYTDFDGYTANAGPKRINGLIESIMDPKRMENVNLKRSMQYGKTL